MPKFCQVFFIPHSPSNSNTLPITTIKGRKKHATSELNPIGYCADNEVKAKGPSTMSQNQNPPVKRKPGRPPANDQPINLSEALKLRLKGLSYNEIARHFGVTKPAVISILKPYVGTNTDVTAFKDHRADLLAAKQAEALAAIDPAKLKKAGARDLAIVFGTLYDKERLERGQSTQNIAAFCASAVIQAHQEQPGDPRANEQQVVTISDTITDAEIVSDCNDKGNDA